MYQVYAQKLPVERDGEIENDGHRLPAYRPNLQAVGLAPDMASARRMVAAPVLGPLPELRASASQAPHKPLPATLYNLPARSNQFLRPGLGVDKTMPTRSLGRAL